MYSVGLVNKTIVSMNPKRETFYPGSGNGSVKTSYVDLGERKAENQS